MSAPNDLPGFKTNPACRRADWRTHGTNASYKKGCRCLEAIDAHDAAKEADRRRAHERRGSNYEAAMWTVPDLPALPVIRPQTRIGRLVRDREDRPCLNYRTDLFFDSSVEDVAKSICAPCPIQDECLTLALQNRENHGVWGATTAQERDLMRARMTMGRAA